MWQHSECSLVLQYLDKNFGMSYHQYGKPTMNSAFPYPFHLSLYAFKDSPLPFFWCDLLVLIFNLEFKSVL